LKLPADGNSGSKLPTDQDEVSLSKSLRAEEIMTDAFCGRRSRNQYLQLTTTSEHAASRP
jgi:hypothetical protein